jgi:hypothetical protein
MPLCLSLFISLWAIIHISPLQTNLAFCFSSWLYMHHNLRNEGVCCGTLCELLKKKVIWKRKKIVRIVFFGVPIWSCIYKLKVHISFLLMCAKLSYKNEWTICMVIWQLQNSAQETQIGCKSCKSWKRIVHACLHGLSTTWNKLWNVGPIII